MPSVQSIPVLPHVPVCGGVDWLPRFRLAGDKPLDTAVFDSPHDRGRGTAEPSTGCPRADDLADNRDDVVGGGLGLGEAHVVSAASGSPVSGLIGFDGSGITRAPVFGSGFGSFTRISRLPVVAFSQSSITLTLFLVSQNVGIWIFTVPPLGTLYSLSTTELGSVCIRLWFIHRHNTGSYSACQELFRTFFNFFQLRLDFEH